MASKMNSNIEWVLVYIVAGTIDLAQFFLGLFGWIFSETVVALVLIAINDDIDPFIGLGFMLYFQFRGVSMIRNWQRALSLLCVGGVDELTGGVASFWILDIWYIHSSVKKEDALERAQGQQQEALQDLARQPLNYDGVREPRAQSIKPLNMDGVRSPSR